MKNISFTRESPIQITSPKIGKLIGLYRPDFLIDNKIILEIKALEVLPLNMVNQLFDYLRNSSYELGYLVNFGGTKLFIKRIIFTNDRKHPGIRGL